MGTLLLTLLYRTGDEALGYGVDDTVHLGHEGGLFLVLGQGLSDQPQKKNCQEEEKQESPC